MKSVVYVINEQMLFWFFLRVPLPQLRNMTEDVAQTLKFMYGSLDR